MCDSLIDELSSDAQLRFYCRGSNPESFEKVKKFVAAGVDVRARSDSGLNALMCAATGHHLAPNTQAFYYLFTQEEQPFSLDEKIDGLELLGASHILNHSFSTGVDCWLHAAELRHTPKVFVPPDISLPKPFNQCEWATSADLDQLNRDVTNIDDEIILVYQAMLVRQRILGGKIDEHVGNLFCYVEKHLANFDYFRFVTMGAFCLEWAKIYGCVFSNPVWRFLKSIIYQLTYLSFPNHTCHDILNFSTTMTIFEWVATELSNLSERASRAEDMEEISSDVDFFLDCVIQLAVILSQMPRDLEQDFRLKKCMYAIVKCNYRNSNGQDLILLACCTWNTTFLWDKMPEIEYYPLPCEKVVKLLIEVDADPNSTDNYGDSGLHYLATTNSLTSESSLVHLLLHHGAHWDRRNKAGQKPLELSNARVPAGFYNSLTLKCLSAKIVRQLYSDDHLKNLKFSQSMLNFVNMH